MANFSTLRTAGALLAALAVAGVAHASPGMGPGTIIGVFSDPVLTGTILNTPSVGNAAFYDDTATAVTIGEGTNSLTWGTNPVGAAQTAGNYSYLSFNGFSNLATGSAEPTQIGTLTYYNGTSAGGTTIFGATLTFYWNTVSAATELGSDSVNITTTQNQYSGTNLTPSQLQADADYVNICGNSSNICARSIESYESTEVVNYQPLTVDLTASYQADPSLLLTNVSLDPVSPGNGYIGSLAPMNAVPEPSSITMLSVGALALLAGLRRRAASNKA